MLCHASNSHTSTISNNNNSNNNNKKGEKEKGETTTTTTTKRHINVYRITWSLKRQRFYTANSHPPPSPHLHTHTHHTPSHSISYTGWRHSSNGIIIMATLFHSDVTGAFPRRPGRCRKRSWRYLHGKPRPVRFWFHSAVTFLADGSCEVVAVVSALQEDGVWWGRVWG